MLELAHNHEPLLSIHSHWGLNTCSEAAPNPGFGWRECCTAAPYVEGRVSGLINPAAACCIKLHAPKAAIAIKDRSGLP